MWRKLQADVFWRKRVSVHHSIGRAATEDTCGDLWCSGWSTPGFFRYVVVTLSLHRYLSFSSVSLLRIPSAANFTSHTCWFNSSAKWVSPSELWPKSSTIVPDRLPSTDTKFLVKRVCPTITPLSMPFISNSNLISNTTTYILAGFFCRLFQILPFGSTFDPVDDWRSWVHSFRTFIILYIRVEKISMTHFAIKTLKKFTLHLETYLTELWSCTFKKAIYSKKVYSWILSTILYLRSKSETLIM